MEYFVKSGWLLCLTAAALEDLRTRQVSLGYLLAGTIPGIWNLCSSDISEHLWAVSIGVTMLLISKATRGALGEGDGWFFLFSAFYWGVGRLSLLFFGSLGIGCIWGMILLVRGKRNASIPLLTCAWPIGVWLIFS